MKTRIELSTTKPVRRQADHHREAGFTVMETAISLLLMAVVGLGASSLFLYAAKNLVSAGDRELAMAVAQQRFEQLRNVGFNDSSLNATSSAGTSTTLTRAGRRYTVSTTVTDSDVVAGRATSKTIIIKVTPDSDSSTWARTVSSVFGSVTLVSQRTALTVGPNRSL